MGRFNDLTGQKFGMLRVLDLGPKKAGRFSWRCLCDCGKESTVLAADLRAGNTRSCGCQKAIRATHRMTDSRPFRIWTNMRRRCSDPKHLSYPRYGGRGIEVCERWSSFEHFWADMKVGYADHLQLDRMDNNGDYEPQNCCWSTRKEQQANTRLSRWNSPAAATATAGVS